MTRNNLLKFLLFGVICFTFLGGIVGIIWYPYHLYNELLTGHFASKYYSINLQNIERFAHPVLNRKVLSEKELSSFISMKFWKSLPLQGTKVIFPTNHPYFKPVPYIIEKEGSHRLKHPKFGLKVVKQVQQGWKEYIKFSFNKKVPFNLHLNDQTLFKIPLVRNILINKGQQQIWLDLFHRDLFQQVLIKVRSIKQLKKEARSFVYDLYILYLRSKYFPATTLKFEFNKYSQIARVMTASTRDFWKLKYYLLQDNFLYIYDVSARKKDQQVDFFLSYIFAGLKVISISQEVQNDIYLSYSNLSRMDKLSPVGYSYLYSDLSLRRGENAQEFLQKMIQFIERDRDAYYFLAPLYTYALHRYKRTFSQKAYFVDEDQELKLRRNIDLEKIREINKVKKEKVATPDKEFSNDQEEIEFYLKETQDSFVEPDDEISL